MDWLRNGHLEIQRRICRFLSMRYTTAVLIAIGFIITRGMGVNLPSTVVYLRSNWTDKVLTKPTQFDWSIDSKKWSYQSLPLAYMVSTILGGFITCLFPANGVLGIAVGGASLMQLFLPLSEEIGPSLIIFINILIELLEGLIFPAALAIWRHWAPPMENTSLITITLFGFFVGEFAGYEVAKLQIMRWKIMSVSFYLYGSLGLVWLAFWWWLSYETPSQNPAINSKELSHIQTSIADDDRSYIKIKAIAWKALASSKPFYAIVVASFCCGWNFLLIFNIVKLVFWERYGLYSESGTFQFATALSMALIIPVAGVVCDHLRRRHYISTTFMRKLFTTGGLIAVAVAMQLIGYFSTDIKELHFLSYGVICVLHGIVISGLMANLLDIGPRYAGLLMGISGGVGALATIIHTFILDATIETTHSRVIPSIRKLFIATFVIDIIGGLVYAAFASGEKQRWAESPDDEFNIESEVNVSNGLPWNEMNGDFAVVRVPEETAVESPPK